MSGEFSMLDLFRTEAETQAATLNEGLLALENGASAEVLESLMRAAHSMKGAARMVDVEPAVRVAHAMEDAFVAAQKGELVLEATHIDELLKATDLLSGIAEHAGDAAWLDQQAAAIDQAVERLRNLESLDTRRGDEAASPGPAVPSETGDDEGAEAASEPPAEAPPQPAARVQDNAIRVSAEALNRLMGLAGEVQVEARWLRPFAESLQQVKFRQTELIGLLDRLRDMLDNPRVDDYVKTVLIEALHKAGHCRQALSERLSELEEFDRRSHNLAQRLKHEVVASRMRPFADGVRGLQRMVRDIARELGKQVQFEIEGLNTQVDRDILEKLEAPINHLLRNALDHGLETPEERRAAGKPEQARLRLAAMHSSGMLSIVVEDDGRGMDLEVLRRKIVERKMVSEEMARDLSEAELMDFIFLPGFSTRDQVTEISGRGVGLDVVHSVVQEMHGVVHAHAEPGRGMRFHMQLPLTLSVMRSLMVEIGGEPYAFPLAQIHRSLKLPRGAIETMEGRQYFTLGNQHVGLVDACQLLELEGAGTDNDEICVVVLGERMDRYGFVVDGFLGEKSLAVLPLDPRLGKVRDVAAASILENGDPCLILDVEDMLRSADLLVSGSRLQRIGDRAARQEEKARKRILVVDDSITVREVERNMLANRGYEVEVAVDGMDGWNAVRTGDYDLVISDIDMPRMNGFEFVSMIKNDPKLRTLPVMIVSYKDREEDRDRGLEVGADYYLTKGSFHDETLLDAVADLIGEA